MGAPTYNSPNRMEPGGALWTIGSGGKLAIEGTLLQTVGGVGIPSGVDFTVAGGAQNHVTVAGQLLDADGAALARVTPLLVYISDAASGAGISDFSPSTAAPTVNPGNILATLVTSLVFLINTDANGAFTFDYTDTAQEDFKLVVVLPGNRIAVQAVVTGDYTD